MATVDYESILNHWKIYDEAERWSIKSLFKHSVPNHSNESFKHFLQNKLSRTAPDTRK
ncbi:hypothetical protein [Desulfogranum marinum]|uniref:hypothetical protein n=1 Tax=Desulfogranum marinum TaxID=453220 RepID=UPI001965D50C|nr:hypothetical protein [Desulfogranum marinum]MBM9513914.1 hypothetical protein [Desulfogranum marinum]